MTLDSINRQIDELERKTFPWYYEKYDKLIAQVKKTKSTLDNIALHSEFQTLERQKSQTYVPPEVKAELDRLRKARTALVTEKNILLNQFHEDLHAYKNENLCVEDRLVRCLDRVAEIDPMKLHLFTNPKSYGYLGPKILAALAVTSLTLYFNKMNKSS